MIAAATLHVLAAVTAIVVGAVVLAGRKGNVRHRRLGYLYLGAMVYLNLAALAIDTDGDLGPFHVLAFVSLANLAVAYTVLLVGRAGRARTEAHGALMMWSYAGVVTAGIGQAAATLEMPVAPVIGVCLFAAGILIHIMRSRSPRVRHLRRIGPSRSSTLHRPAGGIAPKPVEQVQSRHEPGDELAWPASL